MDEIENIKDHLIEQIEKDKTNHKLIYTTYAYNFDREPIQIIFDQEKSVYTDEGYTLWYFKNKYDLPQEALKLVEKIAKTYNVTIINDELIVLPNDPATKNYNELIRLINCIIAINTIEVIVSA